MSREIIFGKITRYTDETVMDWDWDDADTSLEAPLKDAMRAQVCETRSHNTGTSSNGHRRRMCANRQEVSDEAIATRTKFYVSLLNTSSLAKVKPTEFSIADFDPHAASFAPRILQILRAPPEYRTPNSDGLFLLAFARRCPLFEECQLSDEVLASLLLEHASVQTHVKSSPTSTQLPPF